MLMYADMLNLVTVGQLAINTYVLVHPLIHTYLTTVRHDDLTTVLHHYLTTSRFAWFDWLTLIHLIYVKTHDNWLLLT